MEPPSSGCSRQFHRVGRGETAPATSRANDRRGPACKRSFATEASGREEPATPAPHCRRSRSASVQRPLPIASNFASRPHSGRFRQRGRCMKAGHPVTCERAADSRYRSPLEPVCSMGLRSRCTEFGCWTCAQPADSRHVSKRTQRARSSRKLAARASGQCTASLNQFVRAKYHGLGDHDSERFRGSEIDNHFELGGLLDRNGSTGRGTTTNNVAA